MTMLNIDSIRKDFPLLKSKVHGQDLVYLDNAATTQKPQVVLDAMNKFYETHNANIHRGVHQLSELATADYEKAREITAKFINAANIQEIIFTKGATESINLIAGTFPLQSGDEILVTEMEHHSNIVPWQLACERSGAILKVIPINNQGELILDACAELLTKRTKILAVTAISNAIGTINPIEKLTMLAHEVGAKVLVDATQAAPHGQIDVQKIDCDFLVFSAHKVYGPTGVGVLYGKTSLLNALPPYQGGGDMIREVNFEKSSYAPLPAKFEAGTPNIAGVIGLGAALSYVTKLGIESIIAYERHLLDYAITQIKKIPGIRLIGTAQHKAAILSFVMEKAHPHDIGSILDQYGVAIRTGHHCAMPLMTYFKIPATARASFAFYNTETEIDKFCTALVKVQELFHG